jgi:hypothetical protein
MAGPSDEIDFTKEGLDIIVWKRYLNKARINKQPPKGIIYAKINDSLIGIVSKCSDSEPPVVNFQIKIGESIEDVRKKFELQYEVDRDFPERIEAYQRIDAFVTTAANLFLEDKKQFSEQGTTIEKEYVKEIVSEF